MTPMTDHDFAAASASLSDMVRRAGLRLDASESEQAFVADLVAEYRTEAVRWPVGAGSVHMSMSMLRMIQQTREIANLTDLLQMRDDALEIAWARIDELEADRGA